MKKGFTLAEMLVVFVIMGILSTIGIYSYQSALRKGEIDAFISELQSQLTPVVYGQGSESSSQYGSLANFKDNSVLKFGPESSPSNGGVKGIMIAFTGSVMDPASNATNSNLISIKLYNKIGNFSASEKNDFYTFGGPSGTSDSISKTIAIPSGVFFDSVCLVTDSHAKCVTPSSSSAITSEYFVAYHGSNPSPYVFNGSVHQSGFGLRLNFRSPLEPRWYTITFSPFGGMTVGRGCKLQECL